MHTDQAELSLTTGDAVAFIVRGLREGDNKLAFQHSDVYIPHVIQSYLSSAMGRAVEAKEATLRLPDLGPFFYDAAWELCRRGILRPGYEPPKASRAPGERGPNFYLPTTSGLNWLEEATQYDLALLEQGRFAKALAEFHQRFGDGYLERSQEAVRCYDSLAFLGCCAMCGAAAESITLKLAISRDGDEDSVLKVYQSASGRKRIEDIILKEQTSRIRRIVSVQMGKYCFQLRLFGRRSG